MTKDQIQQAIKKQGKWDKSAYEYAINAMMPAWTRVYAESYTKKELIEKFYNMCETRFHCISNFTTFRNI